MAVRKFQQITQLRTDADILLSSSLERSYQIWDKVNPLGKGDAASLSTNLTGTDNDLVFTAKTVGLPGNSLTVAYIDPGGVTATLGVVVTGNAIVVNLGRAASLINTTGTLLKAAVEAEGTANSFVSVVNKAANNGTGLVTALTATPLVGGTADSSQVEREGFATK